MELNGYILASQLQCTITTNCRTIFYFCICIDKDYLNQFFFLFSFIPIATQSSLPQPRLPSRQSRLYSSPFNYFFLFSFFSFLLLLYFFFYPSRSACWCVGIDWFAEFIGQIGLLGFVGQIGVWFVASYGL